MLTALFIYMKSKFYTTVITLQLWLLAQYRIIPTLCQLNNKPHADDIPPVGCLDYIPAIGFKADISYHIYQIKMGEG